MGGNEGTKAKCEVASFLRVLGICVRSKGRLFSTGYLADHAEDMFWP